MNVNDIKAIGVIGAGTMGSGIAAATALNGFKTILYDIKPEAVEKGKSSVLKGYAKLLEKGKIDEENKTSAETNLVPSVDFNSLAECDVIIEAAIENLELKKELYGKLDSLTKPGAILATNTSSFSITTISAAAENHKAQVVGMHFFNPANIMKLVEVIKGEYTAEDTIKTVLELCRKLGKVPVMCKDTPAFIVNRIARSFYLEPLRILAEGETSVETIDKIMKDEGGFTMGPFELMDLIGIDVNLSVTKSVYEAFSQNPKYKPNPIQQKMVDEGTLGRKTKRGFYKYE